jgi:hypothetical protein
MPTNNEVERDDVIKKARHQENKNAGDKRDDGLQM